MKIHAHSQIHKIKTSSRPTQNRQKVTFVYDPDGRDSIKAARLLGSWNQDGQFSEDWTESAKTMRRSEDGTFRAEVYLDPNHRGDWQWGVKADGPAGPDQWAVMEEENLHFRLNPEDGEEPEIAYRPTTVRQNGVNRDGLDVNVSYWAPHAKQVKARFWSPDHREAQAVPLSKAKNGNWSTSIPDAWPKLEGKLYAYEVTPSQGETRLEVDPYAGQRMGPQRGVDDLFLDAQTGREVHKFHPQGVPFTRFEVQEYPGLDSVRLVLADQQGRDLTRDQVLARLSDEGSELVAKFQRGQTSDFWRERLQDSGAIELLPQGKAFAAILPAAEELKGLHYRFEGFDRNGALLGDVDLNGRLDSVEAKALAFNDPYSSELDGNHRWQRYGIVEDSEFDWRHDETPRLATDPNDQILYQIHPGSIFGSAKNVDRTTFKDITERLDYFQDLGVNVLELMPVNSFEGSRDWGYIGSHNMAISENYGFVDEKGNWVEGDEALKQFVDACHSKGFKVFNDVVYNHFGGDFNNVWNVGGPENPWFEWSDNPSQPGESTKATPWGSLPAYNKPQVSEYITNHALNQLDEFHFDGLRFDFTHPIHDQGPDGGGDAGWEMLQKINRTIDFFHPEAFIAAEEFPNHPVIVTPPSKSDEGGAGFDAMWNTEFQHRLVHDHGNPSVLQEAAEGDKTRIDKFMNHLLHQPGFKGGPSSVTVVSNHDEVGNADRTVNVANGHRDPSLIGPWERAAARTTLGLGLLSPGMPMFFQGEESLATNPFHWGTPATWDLDWSWLEKPESPRFKHHQFTKAVLALRNSTDAFDADAEVRRVMTHEDDSTLAFSRKKGGDEYLVVASLNRGPLENYSLDVDGRWDLVLSSDRSEFGGEGRFTEGGLGSPDPRVDLPAGGMLVFKRSA